MKLGLSVLLVILLVLGFTSLASAANGDFVSQLNSIFNSLVQGQDRINTAIGAATPSDARSQAGDIAASLATVQNQLLVIATDPNLPDTAKLVVTQASDSTQDAVLELQLAASAADPDVLLHLNVAAGSISNAIALTKDSIAVLGGPPPTVVTPTVPVSPTVQPTPPIGGPGTLPPAGGPVVPGLVVLLSAFAIGGGALIRASLGGKV